MYDSSSDIPKSTPLPAATVDEVAAASVNNQTADAAPSAEPQDTATASPLEISKKELLALTGISYGQLYRWKREGLIPEDWFIKRSAYTGQETFFPREYILERIKAIQSMKDVLSLSEIKEQLDAGRGRPNLRKILLAIPEFDEAFVDNLGINLDKTLLSDLSIKALATLASALEQEGADSKTQKKLIAQTIKALDTRTQTVSEKG